MEAKFYNFLKNIYKEERVLQESYKGRVVLVRGLKTGQYFVLKELYKPNPVYKELEKLRHEGLPAIYYVRVDDRETVEVEEYLQGQDLYAKRRQGPLEEQLVRQIGLKLCSCLAFLHDRHILHRDIKPSNIILLPDGGVKLIDFDAARVCKERKETDTVLLGTEGYAPPEQYGFAQTDARSDIYALGITLKALLPDNYRGSLNRIIEKATRLNPDDRYQSMQELRRALRFSVYSFFRIGKYVLVFLLLMLGAYEGGLKVRSVLSSTAVIGLFQHPPLQVVGNYLGLVPPKTGTAQKQVIYDVPNPSFSEADVVKLFLPKLEKRSMARQTVTWTLGASRLSLRKDVDREPLKISEEQGVLAKVFGARKDVLSFYRESSTDVWRGERVKHIFSVALRPEATKIRITPIEAVDTIPPSKTYKVIWEKLLDKNAGKKTYKFTFLELLDDHEHVLDFWMLCQRGTEYGSLVSQDELRQKGFAPPDIIQLQAVKSYLILWGASGVSSGMTMAGFYIDDRYETPQYVLSRNY